MVSLKKQKQQAHIVLVTFIYIYILLYNSQKSPPLLIFINNKLTIKEAKEYIDLKIIAVR